MESNSDRVNTAESFVRDRLSGKRYAHTLRVADAAEKLANIHGIDRDRTRLAALLHDAARELKRGDYLRLAGDWGLPIGEHERNDPKLLHGPVAAELARRKLGLDDQEVLEAIRIHTIGKPQMGQIALAVYVADKIEPARDYPSVGRLRELATKDLKLAAAEAFKRTRSHNEERGKNTHPASLRTLEWLEETVDSRVDV